MKKKGTDYSANNLDYILGLRSNHMFSTNPQLSDYVYNQTIVDHLVGTLVRYEPSGRYQNYLLDYWSNSNKDLTWQFQLKKGLKTQNGHPINAAGCISGLKKLLKIYHKNFGKDLFFQYVDGYEEFIRGQAEEIKGIKIISSLKFELHFLRKPIDLIEHLSIPYYGYYSKDNFNSQGEWKSPVSIDSSGPYLISEFKPNKQSVVLAARDGRLPIDIFR